MRPGCRAERERSPEQQPGEAQPQRGGVLHECRGLYGIARPLQQLTRPWELYYKEP
jgi:hypothetical protein